MVVGTPEFARSKPPKFLRTKEIQKLFNSLDLSMPIRLAQAILILLETYLFLCSYKNFCRSPI